MPGSGDAPPDAPALRRVRGAGGGGAGGGGAGRGGGAGGGAPRRRRLRLRKFRVLVLLGGLGVLGAVSAIFGVLMALAAELPQLEQPTNQNTTLVDVNGESLGLLTGTERRVFVPTSRIAPAMKHAIIAVEDERFYINEGVDLRGIARALWHDIRARRAVQGGSTITQQFVKNALAAQNERTLFNKLREAALAYHLTREWSKERILGNYLNTIYFGNGAYGIESAARTYFGSNHKGCEEDSVRPCAAQMEPHEAALLAGLVASPSGYDPLENPKDSRERRDMVLGKMLEQGYLTPAQHQRAVAEVLPQRADVHPPRENTRYPYFTSWVKPQIVDALGGGQEGAQLAFEGGLKVQTTLDHELQEAAVSAVRSYLPDPQGPRAAMVVLDNKTGEVRAMVGGDDHATRPFNLATQGQRQPGSAFKPFVLAAALDSGISPQSTWDSEKREFCVTRRGGKCRETFVVNNYEDTYGGELTLAEATTTSDNAVYAAVGIETGIGKVARVARRSGIRTPISRNYAMTLGGLEQGVTPLDMARSYLTFARGGQLIYGSMSAGAARGVSAESIPAPAAIHRIREPDGKLVELPDGTRAVNRTRKHRVMPTRTARQVEQMLEQVVRKGTAQRAFIGGSFTAGKTGTTENYGDAWFVGWTRRYTAAVWVGYPDRLTPMQNEFAGRPVAGGTFPALIWKSFMEAANRIDEERNPREAEGQQGDDPVGGENVPASSTTPTPPPVGATAGSSPAGDTDGPAPAPTAPQAASPPPAPSPPPPTDPTSPAPGEPPQRQPVPQSGTQPDGGAAPPGEAPPD